MPATLSLAGVLVGGIGGFVLATMYDRHDPVQRVLGCTVGGVLTALGTVLFFFGLFQ